MKNPQFTRTMKSLARSIFILSLFSSILIFLAWIIPCWFGRVYDGSPSSKTLWGLFYVVECTSQECISVPRSLKNENVDFSGATPPLRVEAISVLATISFALSLLGMFFVAICHCHACGRHHEYKNYIAFTVMVQITEGVFTFLTIVTSAVANGAFFSKSRMKNGDEFPWSLFLFCLAEILLTLSVIFLLMISLRWKKYRHLYTKSNQNHDNNKIVEVQRRYDELAPDYRVETYDQYRPYHDYSYLNGSYNDRIIPVNSGHYDRHGVPYQSIFGRTRYYITQPYRNEFIDYSYMPSRQVVPYVMPQTDVGSYWNSGLYTYMPVRSGLWNTPYLYDNTQVRKTEPHFVNEPIIYTDDLYNRSSRFYLQ
ncbi:hypothetical protein ACF0H5_001549 [Mactra antiquata]